MKSSKTSVKLVEAYTESKEGDKKICTIWILRSLKMHVKLLFY